MHVSSLKPATDPSQAASARAGSKDRTVRMLEATTIDQIAAGEVVERPASVLKELVENAIDAGANRIVVDLEDSGCRSIVVADNGCGMDAEDARLALARHATSKIRSLDDLSSATTLGFRGEALPSIASVSRFTLSTGPSDGARTVLRVEGGMLIAEEREAAACGTTVSVEELFYNTPARLKFLKSASTELGQCLDTLVKYAIARPDIAFSASHNGQPVLTTTGSGDLIDAVSAAWSRETAQALVEVLNDISGVRVRGFVSPPHFTKPTRSMQLTYVNGRPVKSRTLTAAIDQAYRMLTPEKRYPIVVLFLDVDPSRIDVNVSPTKSEIKFQHEGLAFDAVRYAIKQALLDSGMIPSAADIAAANDALAGSSSFGQAAMAIVGGGWSGSTSGGELDWRLSEVSDPIRVEPFSNSGPPDAQAHQGFAPVSSARYPFGDLLDGLKVLGQILNTFIVAENRRGLVVIDQHVAHERVLYEYLCGLKGPTAIEIQRLLTPETVHLDHRSAVLLAEQIDLVRDVGFDLEPFGGDTFVLRAAPAALRGKSPVQVVKDLADELAEATVGRKLVPTRESIWIMSSCKMAIKAGDALSTTEMERLIEELAQTENPYLCPHGRPITVTLGVDELLRKFGRK